MNFLMKLFMVNKCGHLWKGFSCWLAAAFILLLAQGLSAQDNSDPFPAKPEPAVYVHDYAGWLTPNEKAMLEQKLRTYRDSTSTQIVVMIRSDIGDYDKASYAFELGNRWGIGRKDKNNGVVMLIKTTPPDRGIFIATGYGTEGAIPDITAGRIIRNTMAPYFRQEQYYQGIDAGVNDIIQALGGEFAADGDDAQDSTAGAIVFLVFLCLFLVVAIAFYRARKGMGTMYANDDRGTYQRGRNRGGYGGGGWWMGGGGGGNDSGWGGGGGGDFGGGSFGGGGAGGDW